MFYGFAGLGQASHANVYPGTTSHPQHLSITYLKDCFMAISRPCGEWGYYFKPTNKPIYTYYYA